MSSSTYRGAGRDCVVLTFARGRKQAGPRGSPRTRSVHRRETSTRHRSYHVDVDDLEEQKTSWGREGRGIPGVNPSYAGRVRVLAAAGVLILAGGAFALVTGGHTQSKTAARYVADVAQGDAQQAQLASLLHNSPSKSVTIVSHFVQTLRKEDQRLSTQRWPADLADNMEFLIRDNQQEVSDLKNYSSASPSERVVLLSREYDDAHQSQYLDSQIRTALDATPTVT
jgi:hypothetical protein